jgi:CheY-like chemotaxis protein
MSLSVLVADDDPGIRALIRALLAPLDLQFIEAPNGRKALELARQADFQVAIIDLIMPETDGFETIRALRRLRPHVGIIAISGALQEELELAGHLGSDAVLAKPIDSRELLDAVCRLIERGNANG